MRQHKLALCQDHYLEWALLHTQRTIDRFEMIGADDRVLVAVSGGKDSLALWDVLARLGYQADALYIGLGIDGGIRYADESYRFARQFADARGLRLITVDVEATYGATIPELSQLVRKGKDKLCSVCGTSKRYVMNRVACDEGYDVLATGHNLDDEVAVLMQNTLQWQTGYLARQAPVLPASADGFARKVKPLCRFYERETAAYAILRGIAYMYQECPFAAGANTLYYKELLGNLEEDRPGLKMQFYVKFLQAKENGFFRAVETGPELQSCEKCGQPSSAPGACAFCRMWDAARQRKGLDPLPDRVELLPVGASAPAETTLGA